jgi:ectoine hydroxylase-related dioxygenase (phytanoyl-CoA dioxygenase family)
MELDIRFNTNTPVATILEAMKEHGCAFVENVLDAAYVAELRAQIAPFLEQYKGDPDNPFNGANTIRFGRLMHRLPKARDLVRHPLVIELLDNTLKKYCPSYKLTFDGVMHVMAGQKAQIFHRDNTHFCDPAPPLLFATLWAMQDFRRSNGGTVYAPGSHKWPEDRKPEPHELRAAEMPEGTRTAVSLQYAVGWMQQEENQALSVPLEQLRTFDEELLALLGFAPIARNTGSVDGLHPTEFIMQDGKYRTLAVPGTEYTNGQCLELYIQEGPPRTIDPSYPVTLPEES